MAKTPDENVDNKRQCKRDLNQSLAKLDNISDIESNQFMTQRTAYIFYLGFT